ncbi:polysaccharide pyruvyl transferase family protein [Amnibacterium endophyticum]|uniref:Polysaccharide pyruvyl transferase family protein n=1 Tax=Amnibacterium endophyticum TaxID=2109337 RepID=A0ABW4LF85_9MICO
MTSRRVLVRAGKHPFTVLRPEAALAFDRGGTFAGNIGNVLFIDSVVKALSAPGVEVVPNAMLTERPAAMAPGYAARLDDEFDALVLPMANAFKPKFLPQLTALATVVERLTIPVTIVGIGAQFDDYRPDAAHFGDEVNAAVRRFVAAVLERSASIGVRGERTAEYLRDLGFADDQVDIIGCPSVFRDADPEPVAAPAPLHAGSAVALSVTPKLEPFWPILMRNLERYPNLTYVPQEAADYALQLYGQPVPYYRSRATGTGKLVLDERSPIHWDHPLYQQDRVRCFVDASTWFDFMRRQDFGFGTRLHGTIAALANGVPGVLLTHDSRTTELAEYHRLPSMPLEDAAPDLDAADLAAGADYASFNAARTEGFARYTAFLEKNGIDHVFKHDGAADAWETELRSRAFPGPIPTLMAPDAEFRRQVASRLTWLRQGAAEDERRRAGAAKPPFDGHVKAAPKPKPSPRPAPPRTPGLLEVVGVDLRRARRAAARLLRRTPPTR